MAGELSTTSEAIRYIRSAAAIRERCGQLFQLGLDGKLEHFELRMERLDGIVGLVKAETLGGYPDLNVPYHSRWRHFDAGGVDREAAIDEFLKPLPVRERVRAKLELAIVSVLLDAGAGDRWGYRDIDSDIRHKRSEGLALASAYAFVGGVFGAEPFTVSSQRLRAITPAELGEAFQVSTDNPLVGLEGRCALLNRLGKVIDSQPMDFWGSPGRLGGLLEPLLKLGDGKRLQAKDLLGFVLEVFSDIWPGRLTLGGKNLGDVWRHSKVTGPSETAGLVPLHKLSQWLTYSLLEPLEQGGVIIEGLDQLTGLAEYRNGGLFIDGGLLAPKNPDVLKVAHAPSSELVVEWRALTVILLDKTAARLREVLGKNEGELPLAKVLQGGTWAVGRKLATGRRHGGGPPLTIESDGTVF